MIDAKDILPPKALEAAAHAREVNAATAEANAKPFPGPLARAFNPEQEIKVGPYTVRPFYDGDFDIIQALDHPFARMALTGVEWGQHIKDVRGHDARVICYLMTQPVDAVMKLKPSEVSTNADEAFYKFKVADFIALLGPIVAQFTAYFDTALGYEADDGSGGKKKQSSDEASV